MLNDEYTTVRNDKEASDFIINHIGDKLIRSNNRIFIQHQHGNLYKEDLSHGHEDTKQFLMSIICNTDIRLCINFANGTRITVLQDYTWRN